ncbi:MAG: transcriptional regulator [Bryobacterales bacterium]
MAAEPVRKPLQEQEDGAAPQSESSTSKRALRLDRVIHERARLAIVSALAANESLSFTELKALLDVSDGNLSVHARKLEEAGYVAAEKSFRNRMPHTEFRLTAEGREALNRYVAHMEALIQAAKAD